jgi:chromosome segregation ATPase
MNEANSCRQTIKS